MLLSASSSTPARPKILVLFNGPPGAGKDTSAALLKNILGEQNEPGLAPHLFKMSQPLKDGVKALFALTDAQYDEVERTKNDPSPLLLGMSFRKAQILLSEEFIKKFWGRKTIFGEMAYPRLVGREETVLISSDTGFSEEVLPLLPLATTSAGHLQIVLVHLSRDGHDFSNDSRDYVTVPGVEPISLRNPGQIDAYRELLQEMVLPRILGYARSWAPENRRELSLAS